MVTASKVLSAKGSFMPSPATFGTSRSVPAASIPREKSHATHHAPDLDSSTVETAVPAARSSTFSPGCKFKRFRVCLRQRRSRPKDKAVYERSDYSPTASNIDATSKCVLIKPAFSPTRYSSSYARAESARSPPRQFRTFPLTRQRNFPREL